MSKISTHVLDTELGRPAQKVPVILSIRDGESWNFLAQAVTNHEGRINNILIEQHTLQLGIYQLTFKLTDYFSAQKRRCFYPEVLICFTIENVTEHFHVPLLLSGFGYSTYRGT